jgi:16S rRNA (cytosine1402-N4)-methyltransferase
MLWPLQNWGSDFVPMEPIHQPVLIDAVTEFLCRAKAGLWVDCTVGTGGHAEAMLSSSPAPRVIGIDRDEEAIIRTTVRLQRFGNRFTAVHADFNHLAEILAQLGIKEVDGILADLGVSSLQLEEAARGFSFQKEGPLDMRMDRRQKLTAANLVNDLSEREIADLIYRYGEEPAARAIARAIVRDRSIQRIETTMQLANVVRRALRSRPSVRLHPATRTFQALRIAVNDELSGLGNMIGQAIEHLKPGGRLAVISFHSLEDRIIKQGFRFHSGRCQCPPLLASTAALGTCPICGSTRKVEILTRRPVQPSEMEVEQNPRARSARLRVCQRL